ncbi:MAG: polysaccharide biosynthesis protein [Motiliproteus sp.]|nr:polysaccharide biosynthesis protein [Motiliproteus sp.]MCW9053465.1 polysaccharide biosynthesis protein [Motiliproteus sp.]
MLAYILKLDRLYKSAFIGVLDTVLVLFSLWLAFSLRLGEFYFPPDTQWLLFAALPIIAIPIYIRLGLYRAVIRYIGYQAMITVAYANAVVALVWSLLPFYLPHFVDINLFSPRSLPFIFWMVLCISVGGSRQLARWFIADLFRAPQEKSVLIYGAGEAGVQLAGSLRHSHAIRLLGFIDDDSNLHGNQISGLKVFGGLDAVSSVKKQVSNLEVLLALPSAGREARLHIIDGLEKVEVAVRSVPSLDDLALGRAGLSELHDIDMSDLLGRKEVAPDPSLLERCIFGRNVMVSGAGGTIGSELCRQILNQKPERLILFEHSEFQLFSVEKEIRRRVEEFNIDVEIVGILGTVLDRGLVGKLIENYSINTIYHAAAYKHVPIVEHNVLAGVRNNVVGTYNLAIEAARKGVENFVLVSTDKAVRPTNTMGASKRLSEMVLQGLQLSAENKKTCFSMVRFGNVLGSSGSVIPLFKEQIRHGGPVTVTDREITRFFMTIPEAALLVIQAGSMGEGGDLFVLDMGEPVKISHLAERMIRLSGHQVWKSGEDGGIAIKYTGLRHGEKLYEELLIGDNVSGTTHPLIMVAQEEGPACADIIQFMSELDGYLKQQDVVSIRSFLLQYVNGFNPQCDLQDTLWLRMSQSGMEEEDRK